MSQEITLQTLIDKVKDDLFSPLAGRESAGKKAYPIFFVENVELEIRVNFTYDGEAGLKIIVPQILEGSAVGSQSKSSAHTIKLSLAPILTREEMRQAIDQDTHLKTGIEEATMLALRKGSALAGEEE